MTSTLQNTYTLIDGRKVANDIKSEIVQKVAERRAQNKKIPHLAIILVGDDGASQTYVDFKVKACKEVGFHYTMMRFADTISEDKLMNFVFIMTVLFQIVSASMTAHYGHNRDALLPDHIVTPGIVRTTDKNVV